MSHELGTTATTCEHEGCTSARGRRSPFCDDHKAEHRRAWNRDRMRRKREEEAADRLLGVTAVSDGRSIPGQSADAHTPKTQHHPTRRFARREEPAPVDYTEPGATARRSIFDRQPPRTDLQRFRAPSMEEQTWEDRAADDYYGGVKFPAADMGEGPYRSYNHAGTPQLFQVVRASR